MRGKYLKRNANLPFSDAVEDIAQAGEKGHVFPISPDTTLAGYLPQLLGKPHAGTFTSACSCYLHRGTAISPQHAGNLFVASPRRTWCSGRSSKPMARSCVPTTLTPRFEILASSDTWCRPVFLADGPDGALYICDMYRKVIDHRKFFPAGVYQAADFEAGKGLGASTDSSARLAIAPRPGSWPMRALQNRAPRSAMPTAGRATPPAACSSSTPTPRPSGCSNRWRPATNPITPASPRSARSMV